MKRLVGNVTETEKSEIQNLYERKNALQELFKIVDIKNEQLYNKVIEDMGKTSGKFQKWWDDKSKLYGWESSPDSSWEIDFSDGSIYLTNID
ncbi:MAG: CXXX repeat peptide modification system protein [Mangrovibacterium sp.]